MLELSISKAQLQLARLLTKRVIVMDDNSNIKKAVIIPYEEYSCLLKMASKNRDFNNGIFNKFVGRLDNKFRIDDSKYNRIIN